MAEEKPEKKKSTRKKAPARKKAARKAGEPIPVLVELSAGMDQPRAAAQGMAAALPVPSFQVDDDYEPVPVDPPPREAAALRVAERETVVVRGTVADESAMEELKDQDGVVDVWRDTPIAPFEDDEGEGSGDGESGGYGSEAEEPEVAASENVQPMAPTAGACPIPPCDCFSGTPRGTIADVARYLGVDQIWSQGQRGRGIRIGIVDGGITAQGRTIDGADTGDSRWPNKLISRVVGGWPTASWGTTGVAWGWHGNMCATDALGMAPEAEIYDIRISGANSISQALAGFHWAIGEFKAGRGPHVLSNSWGIFQEAWDPDYARDRDHPFTRKVVEALDEGILVLFAAGNCGATCPDGRCAGDTGPGKSIWGANGHPRVMTVGAVTLQERFIGYSSQGPAALDPDKPDFCSISHFTGFFNSDSGTSAATPVAAGVVALVKGANSSATQDAVKRELKATAKDIGGSGFDRHSGAGIIRAKAAYDRLVTPPGACARYRQAALRFHHLYRRTGNRRYLCLFYLRASSFYACLYRQTGNRRYVCLYYAYRAAFYCCWYRVTGQRRYLCRCYRYRAAYFCCLHQQRPNPQHLARCRRYLQLYRRCR